MEALPHASLSLSRKRIRKMLGEGTQHGHEEPAFGFGVVNLLGDGDVGDVILCEYVEGVEHDSQVSREPIQRVGDHYVEFFAWASTAFPGTRAFC